MKKLLHEKLRDVQASTGFLLCDLLTETLGIPREKTDICSNRVPAISEAIADEIEKYYIPRPRFEDGEPVQTSDMEEIGGLATCRVYTDGSWVFDPDKYEDERNPKPWDEQQGRQCDFIKRPEPKVLDADGVPCKKGETVWKLADSTKLEIIDIHPTEPRITVRQLDTDKDVSGGWFLAEEYSHREPDSLEKLRDDIQSHVTSGWHISTSQAAIYAGRLTAIMERDA